MHHRAFQFLALLVAVALQVAGGRVAAQAGSAAAPAADLSATVDHPFVPLATVRTKLFAGEERDDETGEQIAIRVEETVLLSPAQVAGIDVTVVRVHDYHNGEFVKSTDDYFAQGTDGTVHYVGERVAEYKQGKIVGHEGAWLAGDQGAQPGVFMPADPNIGETFVPEHVPDVAMEQSTVIAVDQSLTTPAGSFEGCLMIEDVGLLEDSTEQKTYCPEVGLVYENFAGGYLELVTFESTAATTE
jgi:hypothetical protein